MAASATSARPAFRGWEVFQEAQNGGQKVGQAEDGVAEKEADVASGLGDERHEGIAQRLLHNSWAVLKRQSVSIQIHVNSISFRNHFNFILIHFNFSFIQFNFILIQLKLILMQLNFNSCHERIAQRLLHNSRDVLKRQSVSIQINVNSISFQFNNF